MFASQKNKVRNRSSYMSSDDDMVDITTTGTTQEGTLPREFSYQTQGEYRRNVDGTKIFVDN